VVDKARGRGLNRLADHRQTTRENGKTVLGGTGRSAGETFECG